MGFSFYDYVRPRTHGVRVYEDREGSLGGISWATVVVRFPEDEKHQRMAPTGQESGGKRMK